MISFYTSASASLAVFTGRALSNRFFMGMTYLTMLALLLASSGRKCISGNAKFAGYSDLSSRNDSSVTRMYCSIRFFTNNTGLTSDECSIGVKYDVVSIRAIFRYDVCYETRKNCNANTNVLHYRNIVKILYRRESVSETENLKSA